VLDGEVTSYFEWIAAGELELAHTGGAMHQVAVRRPGLESLQFGFDSTRLYLRADFERRAIDLLADRGEVRMRFLTPPDLRIRIRLEQESVTATAERRLEAHRWQPVAGDTVRAAAGSILEAAVDLDLLGV